MPSATSLNGSWMAFHIASVRIKKAVSAFGEVISELIAPTTNSKRRKIMETTDYVSYPIALALKKAGFDWPCDHYWCKAYKNSDKMEMRQALADDYNNDDWNVPHCSAPHIYQVQKWLREKKGIVVTVGFEPIDDSDMVYTNTINRYNPDGGKNVWDCRDTYRSLNGCGSVYSGGWDSYEQALSAGIAAALELIEEKGE